MLNHLTKLLFIFLVGLMLAACHKAPILDNELALKLLAKSPSLRGYAVNIVMNNPYAHGENGSGWTCNNKKTLIDAAVVTCEEAERSGVYLTFTNEGKQLLVGKPWGDDTLKNARVVAVSQAVQSIQSIEMSDKSHAVVHYTSAYEKHTAFSNAQLKKVIPLNIPKTAQKSFTLVDDQWVIDE